MIYFYGMNRTEHAETEMYKAEQCVSNSFNHLHTLKIQHALQFTIQCFIKPVTNQYDHFMVSTYGFPQIDYYSVY